MMKDKSTGIVRGIDNLGRVVLPKELRTALGMSSDSKVEIFAEDGAIVMRKYIPPAPSAAQWTRKPSSLRGGASARPAWPGLPPSRPTEERGPAHL